jgi:apyrase
MLEEHSPFISGPPKRSMVGVVQLMVKDKQKGYGWFQRSSQIMKQSTRYGTILAIIAAVSYFSYTLVNEPSIIKLSPDRSEAYNVKVLPASLTDPELNTLPKETFSYMAMIDAGSSGCRAHVYRYGKLGTLSGPLYVLPEHNSKKVKPGLSTFASNPQDAGETLSGLVDFLKEQVPEDDWAVTPIWLKATAGLRMLEPDTSEAILNSVRRFLLDKKRSPFLFRPSYAKIISGNEEGGFGWIAFNYLKRIIGPKRHPDSLETPYAVVEMGGASAQVSQAAPNPAAAAAIPPQYRFSFTIEKDAYELYTHSYLGYGAEQAREQMNRALLAVSSSSPATSAPAPILDSCVNPGYKKSAADKITEVYQGPSGVDCAGAGSAAGACITAAGKLFKQIYRAVKTGANAAAHLAAAAASAAHLTTPELADCDASTHPGPHSFGCVHQPDFVTQSPNFLAFENFFYMSSAIGVKSVVPTNSSAVAFPLRTTPAHIAEATNRYCAQDFSAVQAAYPVDGQAKEVNLKMCFLGSYAYSFLVDGLRVSPDKVITVQKAVGDSEIEWALGAAYKEAADMLKRTHLRPT